MIYVTMTDSSMSNWGRSDSLINKLIFECNSMAEAFVVKQNADNRTDMKYINICYRKPSYYTKPDGVKSDYYVQVNTKTDHPNWYIENYFNNYEVTPL